MPFDLSFDISIAGFGVVQVQTEAECQCECEQTLNVVRITIFNSLCFREFTEAFQLIIHS